MSKTTEEEKGFFRSAGDWLVNTGNIFYDKYLTDESNKRDFELNAEVQKAQTAAQAQTNRLLVWGSVALAAILAVVLIKK